MTDTSPVATRPQTTDGWFHRARRPDWLGQTVASICWIISVFAYGISSTGDWLQLAAGSSWLVANIASLVLNDE